MASLDTAANLHDTKQPYGVFANNRNGKGELPWERALRCRAPIAVVLMVVPAEQHPLWVNNEQELSPEALAEALYQKCNDDGLMDLLPHFGKLRHVLRARRYLPGSYSLA